MLLEGARAPSKLHTYKIGGIKPIILGGGNTLTSLKKYIYVKSSVINKYSTMCYN